VQFVVVLGYTKHGIEGNYIRCVR